MDEYTFKQFLATAHPYCLGRLNKLTQSKTVSEDVFWEAAFRLWQDFQMGKVKNQRNLKALLFVMAKNLYLNQIRKSKSLQEYSIDPQQLPLIENALTNNSTSGTIDHLVQAEEAQRLLEVEQQRKQAFQKAMEKIGKKCRELLTKFVVEKQRLQKLQESLGYPSADAVKMAKYRCKKKLTSLFQEELASLPN